jgi:hypothetical protein
MIFEAGLLFSPGLAPAQSRATGNIIGASFLRRESCVIFNVTHDPVENR